MSLPLRAAAALLLATVVGLPRVACGQPAAGDDANSRPSATDTAVVEPVGTIESGGLLVDPDFGVQTRSAGLDRVVEMYQWRIEDGEYRRVWNAARIDSSDFDDGHRNPPFPLESRRWWAEGATLDGRPVDREVLQALGEWRVFRPGFSRLPLNMAAAFQPEGDGLGSADNPLQPRIGDLRIRWRGLELPPLQGRVVLRDGVWQLRPSAVPGLEREGAGPDGGNGADGPGVADGGRGSPLSWWWIAVPVLLLLLLFKRRKARRGS